MCGQNELGEKGRSGILDHSVWVEAGVGLGVDS